jgi:hypothetical protein
MTARVDCRATRTASAYEANGTFTHPAWVQGEENVTPFTANGSCFRSDRLQEADDTGVTEDVLFSFSRPVTEGYYWKALRCSNANVGSLYGLS